MGNKELHYFVLKDIIGLEIVASLVKPVLSVIAKIVTLIHLYATCVMRPTSLILLPTFALVLNFLF